jgi:hypothetical protein
VRFQVSRFSLLSENKSGLIKSPDCLPVCPFFLSVCVSPTNSFWTDLWMLIKFVRQMMPLKVTWMPHFFNLVASVIPKWRTFKLLRWVLLLNRMVDFYKILYGGDDIEDDLDSILLNLIPPNIPEWRRFEFLRYVRLLKWLVDLDEMLYCGNDIKGDLDHSKLTVCLCVPH